MTIQRYKLPVPRGAAIIGVGSAAVLLFYKASTQYYPDMLGYLPVVAGIAVLAVALILYFDKNAFTQTFSLGATALIANSVVVVLIGTISLGYFLIAQKYHFEARLVGVLLATSCGALVAGGLLRKHFSSTTWLAYGLTSMLGVFVAGLVWATFFPRLK